MRPEDERIISWENLQTRISEGVPFREPVIGSPKADIFFDASKGELGFTIAVDDESMPTIEPVNISLNLINTPQPSLEIRGADRVLFREFYDFCVEILDLVQLDSMSVASAVDDAWSAWSRLLDVDAILSKEKQLGLIGELWLLKRLFKSTGWETAIESWHDTANSEHDFCLKEFDIEVKSTTAESRIHIIGSERQLMPSLNRPLYLLSLQFTPAAKHVTGALSLRGLVQEIQDQIPAVELAEKFNDRIQKAGWRAKHNHHYQASFIHRTAPALILVNDECPKLTIPMLRTFGPLVEQRINSVSYRVDLTNLGDLDGSPSFLALIPN